jgi:protein TonB
MLLAAQSNGLMGDDLPAWHLKASFTEFGDDGSVSDAGTYEEFWVSPTKFRRTFTGRGFTQTNYGTRNGDVRTGLREALPALLEQTRWEFATPLPSVDLVGKGSFEVQEIQTSGISFECLRSKGTMPVNPGWTYCVGADKPFLRITSSVNEQIQHNRILVFHGHFIAGDLQFILAGKRRLTAHLESIEQLEPVDDALFTPPVDAVPVHVAVPNVVNISAALATGMLLKKVAPAYPSFARNQGITGTVVLEALIGKDGHIRDLKVVSGPSELRDASLEAVQQWLYRPYLFNGQPVEVRTTINVIFAFR